MSTRKTFADFTIAPDLAMQRRAEKQERERRRNAADDAAREASASRAGYKGGAAEMARVIKCGLFMVEKVQELTGNQIHDVKDGFVMNGVTLATGIGWELNQRRDGQNVLFIYQA
jgi:hypothetical protein